MSHSDIARIKQQIQAEYDAAQQALSGLTSGTARHDFMNARMLNIQRAHEHLAALVGREEATAILAHTIWKPEEMSKETTV